MFEFSGFKGRSLWMGAAAIVALASAPAVHAQTQTIHFDIPAQALAEALAEFSRQSGVPVMAAAPLVKNKTSIAIDGDYMPADALHAMIQGTDLSASETTAGGFVLSSAIEVTVTGTHLRNVNPTSPVHVITRKDIDQSGYSQVGDLIRSLPENFSGGQNPGILQGGRNIENQNYSNASTVNLRGLGSGATLTLVNGQGHIQSIGQYSGIVSFITLGLIGGHRITLKPILSSKDGCDDRGIQSPGNSKEYAIETARPGANAGRYGFTEHIGCENSGLSTGPTG